MKVSTIYSKVETFIYEFDEGDLKRILIGHLQDSIVSARQDSGWEFDWVETMDNNLKIQLIHRIEEVVQSEEKNEENS